ncbi:MAG: SemiSWEET family transporter [archaeon]
MFWDFVGVTAAALVSASFLAQIHKGWKTKKMDDVSGWMFLIILAGMLLWLLYGIHIQDNIIIGANAVGCSLQAVILLMKRQLQTRNPAFSFGRKALDHPKETNSLCLYRNIKTQGLRARLQAD